MSIFIPSSILELAVYAVFAYMPLLTSTPVFSGVYFELSIITAAQREGERSRETTKASLVLLKTRLLKIPTGGG